MGSVSCAPHSIPTVPKPAQVIAYDAHETEPNCTTPGYWIWRDFGSDPYCTDSWGDCEACTNNYNNFNTFCCHCIE